LRRQTSAWCQPFALADSELGFSGDDQAIYYLERKLPRADPPSWQHIHGAWSRDRKHVFHMHLIEKNAVPECPDQPTKLRPIRSVQRRSNDPDAGRCLAAHIQGEMMKYDDASWHYGGDFPADLPQAAGAAHIGMFLAWLIRNDYASQELIEEAEGNRAAEEREAERRPVSAARARREVHEPGAE
jgi:hypothetical protein